MNIQKLHDKLVKKANMKKVAGPGAIKLRDALKELSYVRGKDSAVKELKDAFWATKSSDLARRLRPYITPNKELNISRDIPLLKSQFIHKDADLNKLIDKISDYVGSRKQRIKNLAGEDAEKVFEQSIINKYIKDAKPSLLDRYYILFDGHSPYKHVIDYGPIVPPWRSSQFK